MARYNEILVGRFNRGLQKLVGIKGEPPAPQLASEIQPIIPLHLGNEHRILDGWYRYGVLFGVAAVAAQFGIGQLLNPKGSNVIAVLEKFTVFGQSGSSVNVGLFAAGANFTTLLQPVVLDFRNVAANSNVVASSQTQVGGGSSNVWFAQAIAGPSDMILDSIQEIVLAPGHSFQFVNAVVNLTLTTALWWRERFLEDSERTV